MGVQGYLSLYTILLGWQVYDGLWRIMTQLGLIILPFAFIAVKSFLGPFLSMGAKQSGLVGARRFIIHIFAALFVLLWAGAPIVRLSPHLLHFKPNGTKSQIVTPGHTGTSYDTILPVPNDIKVPLYWYMVLAVSNGFTDQAKQLITQQPVDLRVLQNELNLTTIQDTDLKAEVYRFQKECYLPAYNQFVTYGDKGQKQKEIKASLDKYGKDDIAWIGSETFQKIPGFYNKYYAVKPVPEFPYDDTNPHDQVDAQTGMPQWGCPSCSDWWGFPGFGLRAKLYGQLGDSFKVQLAKMDYVHHGDKKLTEDAAIRAVIEKSTGGSFVRRGYKSEEDAGHGFDNFVGTVAGRAGVEVMAMAEYPKIHVLKNMLPIIQALLLFMIIALLAIALPMSGYSYGFCVSVTVFIFSITFCGFLWHLITWFDQFMLQALYGATGKGSYTDPVTTIWHLSESSSNPQKHLVDITISLGYVFVPLFWLTITSWAGIKLGNALSGFKDATKTAEKAGKGAVSVAKTGVKLVGGRK
jgi:hypothetical protein